MALALTRKLDQVILFYTKDGLIRIRWSLDQWGRIKAEIDAPETVTILREELAMKQDRSR